MTYNTILTEVDGKVAVITLNRPQVLNALNDELMDELGAALLSFDADDNIGCIIVTGSEKAFAAGADIATMAKYGFADVYRGDFISRNWEEIRKVRKPVIAAVSGYALGGGCELAMMCDTIMAADSAKFAQPEVKLGIIPGAGGTQRLPRAVSKAKAMDLALTGRMMDAAEAERSGLVARIFPQADLLKEVKADQLPTEYELIAEIDGIKSERRPQRKAVAKELEGEHRTPTVETVPNPTQGLGIPRGDTRN